MGLAPSAHSRATSPNLSSDHPSAVTTSRMDQTLALDFFSSNTPLTNSLGQRRGSLKPHRVRTATEPKILNGVRSGGTVDHGPVAKSLEAVRLDLGTDS